jgi:hypothetical protein
VESLASIARRDPAKRFQHWGDADAGGLRIWWLLRTRLGVPIAPLRTTAAWLRQVAPSGGIPLEAADRAALRRLRVQITGAPCAADADVAEAVALIDALLETGVKVEQERY